MKVNRPNNWVWHQLYDQEVPHDRERGSAWTITPEDDSDACVERVKRLRETVTEVTGLRTANPLTKKPPRFA